MNILAFDASSENISLAILWNNKIIADFNQLTERGSSRLVDIIASYQKKLKIDFKKLNFILIGKGPGSFTGLRVSFAIAKALSLALNKPVLTLESFFAIALPFFCAKHNKVAVIADARKQLIYAAVYTAKGPLKKEKLITLKEFVEKNKGCFFVTYDLPLLAEALKINCRLDFSQTKTFPTAKNLALLALKGKAKPITLRKLEPLYLHPKTCQIKQLSRFSPLRPL